MPASASVSAISWRKVRAERVEYMSKETNSNVPQPQLILRACRPPPGSSMLSQAFPVMSALYFPLLYLLGNRGQCDAAPSRKTPVSWCLSRVGLVAVTLKSSVQFGMHSSQECITGQRALFQLMFDLVECDSALAHSPWHPISFLLLCTLPALSVFAILLPLPSAPNFLS
ncbi:hypothetical protein INR49_016520 [Caranx melampygus]|nr:hypothetical protein INR49_016520 [Caranx melampygus]